MPGDLSISECCKGAGVVEIASALRVWTLGRLKLTRTASPDDRHTGVWYLPRPLAPAVHPMCSDEGGVCQEGLQDACHADISYCGTFSAFQILQPRPSHLYLIPQYQGIFRVAVDRWGGEQTSGGHRRNPLSEGCLQVRLRKESPLLSCLWRSSLPLFHRYVAHCTLPFSDDGKEVKDTLSLRPIGQYV